MHVRNRRFGSAPLLAVLPLAALFVVPCSPSAAAPATAAKASARKAAITPVDFAGLKRVIAGKKGKVVVVNYWATWCSPCLEKLPSLSKLSKRYKKQGVELVNVSFDREKNAPVASKELAKHALTANSYLQKGTLEDFIVGMEPKFSPEEAVNLPRTYVFDRSGKLVKVFDDAQSMPAVERVVRAEAAKKR